MSRRMLVVIALLLFAPTVLLAGPRHITQRTVTVYDRKSGLPSSTITALAQSADGNLWVGTDTGLVRFDGVRFVSFDKTRMPALPAAAIESLATAGDHVWVGTAAGLARWSHDTIEAVPGAPAGFIVRLYEDSRHDLWLSTHDSTFRMHDGVFTQVMLPDGGALGQSLFAEAGDGSVWLGGKTLWRWRDGALGDEIDQRSFRHLARDADGSIWAVGPDALVHFVAGEPETFPLPPQAYVELARGADGSTWLTGGTGLVRVNKSGAIEVAKADSGPFSSLPLHVLVGREGEIWVSTRAGGLLRLRDSWVVPWSSPEGLPGHAAYAIAEGHDGVIVASEDGLAHIATDVRVDEYRPASPPASILEHAGRLWLGSDEGLLVVTGTHAEKVDTAMVSALAAKGDEVWAATDAGLSRYQGAKRVATYTNGSVQSFVSILLAADGAIWVGHRAGACRFVDEQFTCYGAETPNAPQGIVTSITQDKQKEIWFGTAESGLYRVNTGWKGLGPDGQPLPRNFKFSHWQDELPSRSHYVVLDDQLGSLWSSSPRGLTRIVRASLEKGPVQWRIYDEADGMRSAACMSIGMKGLRASDGTLWFATTEGVAVVDPKQAGASVSATTRVTHIATDRPGWLTLDYAPSTLAFADTLSFRHQLEGFDSDWVTATMPTASYTNVPPGSYHFLTEARPRNGSWSDASVENLTVAPRWFQTWAFRIAVLSLVLLLAYAAHRARTAVLVRQTERLEDEVRARTEDLSYANATFEERVASAVAELRDAERMAAYGTMVAGVAHEVRQAFLALGTSTQVLQQQLGDRPDVKAELDLVARETKRVSGIMDELVKFARPAKLTRRRVSALTLFAEAVELFHTEHDPQRAVTVETHGGATLEVDEARMVEVLVNLMGNAHKHASGITRIVLGVGTNGLTIENDGIPLETAQLPRLFELFYAHGSTKGLGLGLAIVQRLVELHGGTVKADISAIGTRFTIVVPTFA